MTSDRPATTRPDPRPLVGEPIALDLLNTRWRDAGQPHDLLVDAAGLGVWLAANGLDDRSRADDATLRATLAARDALAAAVAGPADPAALAALNEVLGHCRLRRRLTPDGPTDDLEVGDPAWLPACAAADGYLGLLRAAPDRVRRCAHPDCVLYFFDTSRNGTRRWHSMATCGNRAKASRHYARGKADA